MKAAEDTEVLSKELAIKNEEIKEKKAIVEELIADITEKSEIAAVQQQEAAEKKKFLDVESVVIAREEAEASKELLAAEPIFAEAKAALSTVKKDEIAEIRALAQPPAVVQIVITICYYLYPATKSLSNDDWGNVKTVLLSDPRLLGNLQNYDIEKLKDDRVRKARSKVSELEKKLEAVGDPDKLLSLIKGAS